MYALVKFNNIELQGSEIVWTHNEKIFPDATTALLHIPSARREHAGEWRCTTRNAAGAAAARPTIVNVLCELWSLIFGHIDFLVIFLFACVAIAIFLERFFSGTSESRIFLP